MSEYEGLDESIEVALAMQVAEQVKRIAELEGQLLTSFENGVKEGMERAAEIVENTRSATGHERNLTQVELCAEAIRKEIT